ncbi:MAG: helix-turn-helix domain-containing protein [Spirulinaceae cyanobacterium]
MAFTQSERYIELLGQSPPRPITSKEELVTTQNVINELLDSEILTLEEEDYLNVLGALVFEYEEENIAIPDISGIELLKTLIDEFYLEPKELISVFKTESILAEVLNGKRNLTLEQIDKLSMLFHISPAAFFPLPPRGLTSLNS